MRDNIIDSVNTINVDFINVNTNSLIQFTNNSIDMNLNSISNVSSIFTENLNVNGIINITPTSTITDVATNIVVPFYVLASNIASNTLVANNWIPLFVSTYPSFTVNSNIFIYGTKIKVSFTFTASINGEPFDLSTTPPFSFYYTLSNTQTNTEYIGFSINSNSPIFVNSYQSPYILYYNSYSFSYEDIFDFNTNLSPVEVINVNLYAITTELTPSGMAFITDTHNISFQPIQSA